MKLLWTIAIGIIFTLSACATSDTPPPPTSTPLAVYDFPESAPTPSGRNLQPDLKDIDVNIDEVVALLPPESRAYPIPFMSRHEIVNDFVGGKYIAATW